MIEVVERAPEHDAWVLSLLSERWSGPNVVSRGVLYDASKLPGFVALLDGRPVGLLTHDISDGALQVVSLDSEVENQGVGSALLEAVQRLAIERGCSRLWLITTNDNLHALRFYQRRGMHLVALHANAIATSRRLKPSIH